MVEPRDREGGHREIQRDVIGVMLAAVAGCQGIVMNKDGVYRYNVYDMKIYANANMFYIDIDICT